MALRSLWLVSALVLALGASSARAIADAKNWTPPPYEIYAQTLAKATMAQHPGLVSVTIHANPPGKTSVYTMIAGSYHDRIGNADDPDDIYVQQRGSTIVDPRWHKFHDTVKKFVVQMPMRDAAGENVGMVVYAFKNPHPSADDETKYYLEAIAMRNALESKIPSYAALFRRVK